MNESKRCDDPERRDGDARRTIVDAAKLMISHRISGVPVVTRRGGSSGSLPKVTCCAEPRPAPSATAVYGAGGFRRTPDWLPITLSRMPDEWLTS